MTAPEDNIYNVIILILEIPVALTNFRITKKHNVRN